jgi:hypothetical protein
VDEFNYSVQTLQCAERRQKLRAILERAILTSLDQIYICENKIINSRESLERWGVDADVFELVFPGWQTVEVSEGGTLVSF